MGVLAPQINRSCSLRSAAARRSLARSLARWLREREGQRPSLQRGISTWPFEPPGLGFLALRAPGPGPCRAGSAHLGDGAVLTTLIDVVRYMLLDSRPMSPKPRHSGMPLYVLV